MAIGDDGDIKRIVCANESCGYIISEHVIKERADGTKHEVPRSLKLEDQPESAQQDSSSDDLPTAAEMLLLAMQTQENTVGKAAKEIAKDILKMCAENVLKGEHTYLIKEEDSHTSGVITQAVRELKDRGYKVKKTPLPGKGTEVYVKWPTKKTQSKKKVVVEAARRVEPVDLPLPPPSEKQRRQQAELAKRREALKTRSASQKLPPSK